MNSIFLIETHTLSKKQCPFKKKILTVSKATEVLFCPFNFVWLFLLAHVMSSICVCSRLRQEQCQRELGSRTSCFCRICELIALSYVLLSLCFNQAKMLTHKRGRLPWRMLNNSYSRWITLPTHRCDLFMRWYQESMSSVKDFVFKTAKNIFKGL